jgi:hypothetical protein
MMSVQVPELPEQSLCGPLLLLVVDLDGGRVRRTGFDPRLEGVT